MIVHRDHRRISNDVSGALLQPERASPNLFGDAYDPKAFANVSDVDVNLVEAIQTFLKVKKEMHLGSTDCKLDES